MISCKKMFLYVYEKIKRFMVLGYIDVLTNTKITHFNKQIVRINSHKVYVIDKTRYVWKVLYLKTIHMATCHIFIYFLYLKCFNLCFLWWLPWGKPIGRVSSIFFAIKRSRILLIKMKLMEDLYDNLHRLRRFRPPHFSFGSFLASSFSLFILHQSLNSLKMLLLMRSGV